MLLLNFPTSKIESSKYLLLIPKISVAITISASTFIEIFDLLVKFSATLKYSKNVNDADYILMSFRFNFTS